MSAFDQDGPQLYMTDPAGMCNVSTALCFLSFFFKYLIFFILSISMIEYIDVLILDEIHIKNNFEDL